MYIKLSEFFRHVIVDLCNKPFHPKGEATHRNLFWEMYDYVTSRDTELARCYEEYYENRDRELISYKAYKNYISGTWTSKMQRKNQLLMVGYILYYSRNNEMMIDSILGHCRIILGASYQGVLDSVVKTQKHFEIVLLKTVLFHTINALINEPQISRCNSTIRRHFASNVLARMGNVFEGGAHLTVLPCSSKGTVSSFTETWAKLFQLPMPKDLPEPPKFGDVSQLIPFTRDTSITEQVVYAASVFNDSSSDKIIKGIAAELGNLTQLNPSIRFIETPLLGTGAGGLKTEVAGEALYRGFHLTAHPDSALFVLVPDQERQTTLETLFKRLESERNFEE